MLRTCKMPKRLLLFTVADDQLMKCILSVTPDCYTLSQFLWKQQVWPQSFTGLHGKLFVLHMAVFIILKIEAAQQEVSTVSSSQCSFHDICIFIFTVRLLSTLLFKYALNPGMDASVAHLLERDSVILFQLFFLRLFCSVFLFTCYYWIQVVTHLTKSSESLLIQSLNFGFLSEDKAQYSSPDRFLEIRSHFFRKHSG